MSPDGRTSSGANGKSPRDIPRYPNPTPKPGSNGKYPPPKNFQSKFWNVGKNLPTKICRLRQNKKNNYLLTVIPI